MGACPKQESGNKTMRKKTIKQTTKPLASALTVACSVEPRPTAAPQRLGKAAATAEVPTPKLPSSPAAISPKACTQPPSQASPERGGVAQQARTPTSPQTVSASFAFYDPQAKQVNLSGEFNGWSPTATPMKRQGVGLWLTTLALRAGCYQYKFVVDGHWLPDPNAHAFVPNEFGSLNSVIEVPG
jgi:hypothetical protein